METKTILITDVNADAGIECVHAFISKGYSVRAMFSGKHPEISNVDWIEAEIQDPESYFPFLSNVDMVIHNAILFSIKSADDKKLKAYNTIGTRDLVNNAILAGVKEIIFISSAYTLIRSAEPQVISAAASGNPVFLNHYTQTMFQAELEIHRAAAEGMKICIMNCALLRNEPGSGRSTFWTLANTLSNYPKLFHQQLPYLLTQDLAKEILKVIEEEKWGRQILLFSDVFKIQQNLKDLQLDEESHKFSFFDSILKSMPPMLILKFNALIGRDAQWFTKASLRMFQTSFYWQKSESGA